MSGGLSPPLPASGYCIACGLPSHSDLRRIGTSNMEHPPTSLSHLSIFFSIHLDEHVLSKANNKQDRTLYNTKDPDHWGDCDYKKKTARWFGESGKQFGVIVEKVTILKLCYKVDNYTIRGDNKIMRPVKEGWVFHNTND